MHTAPSSNSPTNVFDWSVAFFLISRHFSTLLNVIQSFGGFFIMLNPSSQRPIVNMSTHRALLYKLFSLCCIWTQVNLKAFAMLIHGKVLQSPGRNSTLKPHAPIALHFLWLNHQAVSTTGRHCL